MLNEAAIKRVREHAAGLAREGRPLHEILAYLVHQAESASGGDAVCSVLLLDKDGLLRNGASPGLPADYLDAIDRLKPDPAVDTCAAAAATGKVVITPTAWSVPIVAADGRVLGTFGTYFRSSRSPRPEERTFVEALAQVARAIIDSPLRQTA